MPSAVKASQDSIIDCRRGVFGKQWFAPGNNPYRAAAAAAAATTAATAATNGTNAVASTAATNDTNAVDGENNGRAPSMISARGHAMCNTWRTSPVRVDMEGS